MESEYMMLGGIRLDVSDLHSTGIAASRKHVTQLTTAENTIETIKQELL